MNEHSQNHDIGRFAELLRHSDSIFFITGAGISADSGLPTYRGIGGLYNDEATEDGMLIEEALSGSMFRSRPEITWKYLSQIEQGARGAEHNRAHEIIAEMEQHYDRVWVLTQNIDGFHTSAGSKNVIEIHGNMYRLKCTQCEYIEAFADYTHLTVPPACPLCQAMARPDVVLFEEQLPENAIHTLYRELSQPFDLVVSIGTSSYFPYIMQPVYEAARNGIATVEINPSMTPLSDVVDLKLAMGAKDALDQAWSALRPSKHNQVSE